MISDLDHGIVVGIRWIGWSISETAYFSWETVLGLIEELQGISHTAVSSVSFYFISFLNFFHTSIQSFSLEL